MGMRRKAPDREPQIIARGMAGAPGTCGELAQGSLGDRLAMVTCPVDMYAVASVELREGSGRVIGPSESRKALEAAERTLEELSRTDLDAHLRLQSALPGGKGMGSSTADILAAVGAIHIALGIHLSPGRLADIALAVEPTDGVMYPGVVLFDHLHGTIRRPLGNPPPMRVVVLEFGGSVDTQAFNQQVRQEKRDRSYPHLDDALDLIEEGIARGSAALIGKGATRSARAYQSVLYKPQMEVAIELGRQTGAVGVNVAHSGTVMGLLFAEDAPGIGWAVRAAPARFQDLTTVHLCRLIGGGVVSAIRGGSPIGLHP
ncbi:MAG: GHMP kinase [Acidimicrobiia bacterium]|nr:GHMP kinase [Acidimicrobiia bacterium]